MAKPRVIDVDSLTTFTQHVEQLLLTATAQYKGKRFGGNWYRGVGRANTYTLQPTLYRHPTKKTLEELIILEAEMMLDFERQGVLHNAASATAVDQNDLRTLFYMQHYQVPTRLLDWSTNPFISLYFALSSAAINPKNGRYEEDAAVWVLDPVAWNSTALSHIRHGDAGPLSHDTAKSSYGPRKLIVGKLEPTALSTLNERPAAVLGTANNARMFAQRGVFTIFGRALDSMETQYQTGKFPEGSLTKLVIDKGKIAEVLALLLNIGYTDSVSYPDLHGVAMEIKRLNGFRV
ncbi:FRG domain-containing protein [Herbaspirillum frisingense]|uniref:FRG domain-containing protein n=1 Tax=Herbaspirillum frisingense TaxID=92645 RepID=UPI0039B029AB